MFKYEIVKLTILQGQVYQFVNMCGNLLTRIKKRERPHPHFKYYCNIFGSDKICKILKIKGDKWSKCKKKANKIKKDTTVIEKRKEIRETVKKFWASDYV